MSSYVTHLESAIDGSEIPARTLQSMHKDRPLWVRYDLEAVSKNFTKTELSKRKPDMWRYRELLPVEDFATLVTLGEGMTPLLATPRLGKNLGFNQLYIKDESQLPTGSFKSRGQAAAISMANYFGVRRVAIPTAGNAGGAMAAYAARAGMEAYVFMPQDTPRVNQIEAVLFGAKAYLVNGLINDCGRIVREGIETVEWFDISTLKEPYRIEGKKTMGLELAEQLDWQLPDVIIYPTGGGTGLIGMWKAFQELAAIGWLTAKKIPRMVAVQSTGCCPIVRAFDKQERFAELHEGAHTIAAGIRVPAAVGDFMILDAIKESGGCAIAVEESSILAWMQLANRSEGISVGPESAACVAAAKQLKDSNWIDADEQVVIFNCGAAQKYPDIVDTVLPMINKDTPIDYHAL